MQGEDRRGNGEGFWTARKVRQGCPLSPLLFNLMIADIEEKTGRVKWGGVRLSKEKVYTLAYADDMVLMAEGEDEMRSLIERLEECLDKKRLELNPNKTTTMRFKQEGGRIGRKVWR